MAQYFTDFSEYTVDAAPSDWTQQFGTRSFVVRADAGAAGGQLLEISGAADLDFFVWDAINGDAERDDSEVLFKFRFLSSVAEIRALQRGVDNLGREGYICGPRPDSDSFHNSALTSGTFNDLGSASSVGLVVDTWYWVSVIVRGASQELRVWADGGSRPGTADVSDSNGGVTAAGWIGLYSNRSATIEVDIFSVGTGTDDAPTSPVSTTTPGISSKTLERLGAAISAAAADVFVWAGHDVDMGTTTATHKALGATITSGVLQEIDLSSTSIAVNDNITVVVIPATGGPGIAIETTAEDLA